MVGMYNSGIAIIIDVLGYKRTRRDYFEARGTQAANNEAAAGFNQRADTGKRVSFDHYERHHGYIRIVKGGYLPLREE